MTRSSQRMQNLLSSARQRFDRLPSKTRQVLSSLLLLVLLLLLVFTGYHLASSEDALAELTDMRGASERDRAEQIGEWRLAKLGNRFHDGDGARTGKNASADFSLFTGARLHLKPSSQVRFMRRGGEGAIGLSVEVGEVDLATKEGVLTVDSGFGEIVIETNSSVTLRRDGEKLTLDVELGSVEMTGQTFEAGTHVELELGGVILDSGPIERFTEPSPAPTSKEEPTETKLPPLKTGDGVLQADVVARPGAKFTIHDPKPPTAIGFERPAECKDGLLLVIGDQRAEARKQANLRVGRGRHTYEIRCVETPNVVAAEGSFIILRDSGTRPLPTFHPTANVVTDGRRYKVLFQQKLPRITVSWASAPQADSYRLTVDGRTRKTKRPSYTFQPGSLAAGDHTVSFAADTSPRRQSRVTTISILYDSQAPTASVAQPHSGSFSPGDAVTVAGQALPGWNVELDGEPIELDASGRFKAETKATGALPVAFSHPRHGLHYYIRRPASP